MVSNNIKAFDVSLDNANLNFNQTIKTLTEIKLSLGEIISTKKEPIPSVFWLKVGLLIGIPTILNIASIIMNFSGIRIFYW